VLYSKDKVDLSNKTLKNINKDLPTFTLNVE
jgi:hypothetical protein